MSTLDKAVPGRGPGEYSRCDFAWKQGRCERCRREFVCTPSDDLYCTDEGDHCCEGCLLAGYPQPLVVLDPTTAVSPAGRHRRVAVRAARRRVRTPPRRGDEVWTGLPASLAARPRDPRRALPIPPVNVHCDPDTGEDIVDFTNINTTISTDVAADRRCSLCGAEMGYWVAFLGGPRAAALMRYTDPPGVPGLPSRGGTAVPVHRDRAAPARPRRAARRGNDPAGLAWREGRPVGARHHPPVPHAVHRRTRVHRVPAGAVSHRRDVRIQQ
jgi:hypothetical protein